VRPLRPRAPQYVLLKPLLALLAMVLTPLGMCPGAFLGAEGTSILPRVWRGGVGGGWCSPAAVLPRHYSGISWPILPND